MVTRNRYTGKNKPARLVLTHGEARLLLAVLDGYTRTVASNPTLRSIKTKLGVEIARVGGGKLRGSR